MLFDEKPLIPFLMSVKPHGYRASDYALGAGLTFVLGVSFMAAHRYLGLDLESFLIAFAAYVASNTMKLRVLERKLDGCD